MMRRAKQYALLALLFFSPVVYWTWSDYFQGRISLRTGGVLFVPVEVLVLLWVVHPSFPYRSLIPLPPRWLTSFVMGASLVLGVAYVGPFLLSLERSVLGVLAFLVLSLLLVVPWRFSNVRFSLYQETLRARALALYWWVPWVDAVLRSGRILGGVLEGLLVVGFVGVVVAFLLSLEYRVDWAALQREVEARTSGASA